MVKKYKTVGNLNKVWNHLDNALSEIQLAMEDLYDMKLEDDGLLGLKEELEKFDFSLLVNMKNNVEEMITKKGGTLS